MSDVPSTTDPAPVVAPPNESPESPVESPPPTARPAEVDPDEPRIALNRLAASLTQHRSTRFLLEYLRLRRMLRST